jgi:hypothetical protein
VIAPRLRKQYFDAVAPDGRWWIAYRAEIALMGLSLAYEELNGDGLERPWWRIALGRPPGPARFGNRRAWAEWTPDPPAAPLAFETEAFVWRLTGVGGGFAASSGGKAWETYSEVLELKTGPWALGLATLAWGRVAAAGGFVTWIVGAGARPVRFAVMGERAFSEGVKFDGERLTTPAGELRLGEPLRTISRGDVRDDRAPLVRALSRLAFGTGRIRQDKASRRGELRLSGQPARPVVAIAETVVFEP